MLPSYAHKTLYSLLNVDSRKLLITHYSFSTSAAVTEHLSLTNLETVVSKYLRLLEKSDTEKEQAAPVL